MRSPIKKMMVYVDGTEQSVTAARFAICLASFSGAELIAHYVIDTRAIEDLLRAKIFLKDEQLDYEQDMTENADRYLSYVRRLAAEKGVDITERCSKGSVHQEIVRVIKEEQVDLLILGELSRVRSRRDELYDESERAMRTSPCSVLVVKDEDNVWELYETLE